MKMLTISPFFFLLVVVGRAPFTSSRIFSRESDADVCTNNIIYEWNQILLDTVIIDHNGPDVPGSDFSCTQGPPASAYRLALISLSMYDALGSVIETEREPYLLHVPPQYEDKSNGISYEAAVATAAYTLLDYSYSETQHEVLHLAYEESLNQLMMVHGHDEKSIERGTWVGQKVADGYISAMMHQDKMCTSNEYDWRNWAGQHQLDPLHPNQGVISPNMGLVPLLVMSEDYSVSKTAVSPPDLSSHEYEEAYNEVKRLGGDGIITQTERTWKETVVAWYHSYNGTPLLGPPPVLMNVVARKLMQERPCDPMKGVAHVSEVAYMFAQLNLAMGDSGVIAWKEKFGFNVWRPINAIRTGNMDGDDDGTPKDPEWTYLGGSRSNPFVLDETNFSPAFPAYPSGHASFCFAGMRVLENIFGTNDIEFDFLSGEWDGVTTDDMNIIRPKLYQTFKKLSHFAAQCAASRVWNGVHFRMDGTEGARLGQMVADEVYEKHMTLRKGRHSKRPKRELKKGKLKQKTGKIIGKEIVDYLEGNIPINIAMYGGETEQDVEMAVNKYLDKRRMASSS
jgi:hypothetical protein